MPKIILIEHFGVPFISNDIAMLIATGVKHHIVLLR